SRDRRRPATRGKLKALAGLGVSLVAAVPDRWSPLGLGTVQRTTWGDESGVRTVPIPVKGSTAPDGDPTWTRSALRRLLTDSRPAIIQIEEEPWTRAAGMAAALARRLRVPYVVLTRESLPLGHGAMGRLRRSRVLGQARGLIGVNELAVRLVTRQRPSLRAEVIPQLGVSLPLQAARPEGSGLTIGFFGRLIPEKGLDLLFRACVKLVGRWTISVVGTGPAQEELEGLAERLGIAGRVTWYGALPRQRVDEVWSRLDCVVLPSRTAPQWVEAAPRAAVEAMAHGVVVVASKAGALPETVGAAGIVVPEEDVEAIVEALQRLHDDRTERERLAAEGRRRAMQEYTDAAVAEKTLRFWREIIAATA
ncbi:MAG TPA: glycosyltransferase, partial [Gemmatimonadales bacterium]|nr:glycosyltransferase [Gemmatimonadales bacterium]